MRDRMLRPLPGALDAVFSSQDIDYCVEAFELRWLIMPASRLSTRVTGQGLHRRNQPTSSRLGQRGDATRDRSASSSASEVTGIVNGRTAVLPDDFSVVADMWASLDW
jgi:hypothetical protein